MVGAGPSDGVNKELGVIHSEMLVWWEIWWEHLRNPIVCSPTVTKKGV